ncbi:MAG: sulfite exporter TauE/SafE family protein [bacterium]|nr:sulfite exporter TauE/SafE family protein [bacterium]
MEVWTGFVVGLLGSLHCVGMCGPIVAALPQGEGGKMAFLAGRLLYNLGRVVTYAIIGLIFGLIGKTIFMAGYQQGLSIAVGVVIIVAVITPSRYSQGAITMLGLGKVYARISKLWGDYSVRKAGRRCLQSESLTGFCHADLSMSPWLEQWLPEEL